MTEPFNLLKTAKKLRDAGFTSEQADALTEILNDCFGKRSTDTHLQIAEIKGKTDLWPNPYWFIFVCGLVSFVTGILATLMVLILFPR